jgi:hypothetical protein
LATSSSFILIITFMVIDDGRVKNPENVAQAFAKPSRNK